MGNYARPKTIDELIRFLDGETVFIAGGTDLMVELKKGHEIDGKTLVDLNQIQELKTIRVENDRLVIGSGATHDDILHHQEVGIHLPVLRDACRTVGSPQIRNRGTLGGSIGTASPASDPLPALLLGNAQVLLNGTRGVRKIPLADFILGQGKLDLNPGEFIQSFNVETLKDYRQGFLKIGRRKALTIARLNFAAALLKDDSGRVLDLRIAIGAALPVAKRFTEVEELLKGQTLTKNLTDEAGDRIGEEIIGVTGMRKSTAYKLPVIKSMVSNLLMELEEKR